MIKRTKVFGFLIFSLVVLLNFTYARQNSAFKNDPMLKKWLDTGKYVWSQANIANWNYWVKYDGTSAQDPDGNSGGIYPKGTAGVIFQDGFIWGGYLTQNGERISEEALRVGGFAYRMGVQPGWINNDGTPVDPGDARARLYRIRKDWKTLTLDDVAQDAADIYRVNLASVTNEMKQAVLDQYEKDWQEWPADLGAPFIDKNGNGKWDGSDVDEPGIANADQVIWYVLNDLNADNTTYLYGSKPIGFELQITIWSYNQPNSTLGQMIFKKYKIINKSVYTIDSMYVCQWADPDLGNYSDDLAGCDVSRSLGFAYNGYASDADFSSFGLPPASVGYDFFQGPIVYTGEETDTAIYNLSYRVGYKNLPMTSFAYFAAGSSISDPTQGQYIGTLQWYNLLRGFLPNDDIDNPSPFTHGYGPNAGEATKFPLDGDPFAMRGDIDGLGTNLPPGDRRILLPTGPFTFAPGDTQEIVVAVIGGIINQAGGNNRNAVAQLKMNDDFAQYIFNKLFRAIPKPPAAPKVKATPFKNSITLNWGYDLDAVKETEKDDPILGFNFEGYNVYQLPGPNATKEQGKLIATFDKVNNVLIIRGKKFDATYGDVVEVPLQKGTDNGIQRYITINRDYIKDRPLYPGNKYYFSVTAYNYNADPTFPEPSLESDIKPIVVVTPQAESPGNKYNALTGDEIPVEHQGLSDGIVKAIVVDPAAITGHKYQVVFQLDEDSTSETFGQLLWNVKDLDANKLLLDEYLPQLNDINKGNDLPIMDGLLIKVSGPAPGIKSIVEVANQGGPIEPDNVWHSLSSASDANGRFYIGAGGGAGTMDRMSRSIANANSHDFEIRFTDAGGIYCWWYDDGSYQEVPFEAWDVGISTYDDASDDVRLAVGGYSGDDNPGNVFDYSYVDPYFGFPASDWIYLRKPLDDEGTYDKFVADVKTGNPTFNWWGHTAEVLSRIIICDYSLQGKVPATGTVIRFITNKPIMESDVFTFDTAPYKSISGSTALAKEQVEKITVFPNPYYTSNPEEPNRFERFVTFTYLPKKATIRIFSLSGNLVRKLEKDSESQFFNWDLKNSKGLPVGSGMYLAYIDMPELGKSKVLKIMIIQPKEVIEYF